MSLARDTRVNRAERPQFTALDRHTLSRVTDNLSLADNLSVLCQQRRYLGNGRASALVRGLVAARPIGWYEPATDKMIGTAALASAQGACQLSVNN